MYYIQLNSKNIPNSNSLVRSIKKNDFLTWGTDDKYPLFLNSLYVRSALHSGIVNGKVLRLTKLLPAIDEMVDKNGSAANTITELLRKCLFDFEIKNAFAIKVINDKVFKKRIYEYVNIDNVRISKDGSMFYLLDYSKSQPSIIKELPNYFTVESDESLAVYYADTVSYYDYETQQYVYNYYPMPPYAGGIEAIMTDIEISSFHYHEIINDFLSGTLVNFSNGIPATEQEKLDIINKFRRNVQDKSKRGGIVVTFSNGRETAPEITPLNGNDLDTRYLQLSEDVMKRILTAHTATSPLLFGIKTPGQLGGTTELQEAERIFNENYVYPRFENFRLFIEQVIKEVTFTSPTIKQEQQGISESEIIALIESKGIEQSKLTKLSDYFELDSINPNEMLRIFQFEQKLLTEKQDKVLTYLLEGESLSRIAQLMNLSSSELYDILSELQRLKALDDDYIPTRKAKSMISDEVIAVFYEYRVRPGLGDPIIPTTREFCKRMVKHTETKALTRADIDEISRRVGRDVWYYRGGWYHDKASGVNFPHCRHYWVQFIGKINKKLL